MCCMIKKIYIYRSCDQTVYKEYVLYVEKYNTTENDRTKGDCFTQKMKNISNYNGFDQL